VVARINGTPRLGRCPMSLPRRMARRWGGDHSRGRPAAAPAIRRPRPVCPAAELLHCFPRGKASSFRRRHSGRLSNASRARSETQMRVLISGAGPAGLTAAYWLRRYGFSPTIAERAPSLLVSGYKIDVRGAALAVPGRPAAAAGWPPAGRPARRRPGCASPRTWRPPPGCGDGVGALYPAGAPRAQGDRQPRGPRSTLGRALPVVSRS